MSSEMILADGFQALTSNSRASRALAANFSTGEQMSFADLTKVGVPSGGITQWQIEDITGSQSVPAITGICCYYAPYGVLWPTDEPSEDGRPLLVTHDLVRAFKVGDSYGDTDPEVIESCKLADGSYDWRALPYNQYGTAKGGHGKRCKELRLMALLRPEDTMPLLVRISPGSLRPVTQFFKKLPVPFFEAIIELSLKKEKSKGGVTYAQVVPRLVGTLTEEQGAVIESMYTRTLAEAARSREFVSDADSLE